MSLYSLLLSQQITCHIREHVTILLQDFHFNCLVCDIDNNDIIQTMFELQAKFMKQRYIWYRELPSCVKNNSYYSWLRYDLIVQLLLSQACSSGRCLSIWNLPASECISRTSTRASVQDVLFDDNQVSYYYFW